MKLYGVLFLLSGVTTCNAAGLLKAESFPGTFQDLSFQSRLAVLAEGYDGIGVEYDENGRCISGCAYSGITLAEEEQLIQLASSELQQVIIQEEQYQAQVQGPIKPETSLQPSQPVLQPDSTPQSVAPVKSKPVKPVQSHQPVKKLVQKAFFRPPVANDVKIGSDFGERRQPKTSNGKGSKYHRGIDVKATTGTPLYAAADGVVVEAGKSAGYGNVVKIQHSFSGTDKKAMTVYAHLSKINVKKGQLVSQGQLIGAAGNTGNSGGAHLHYELRFNDIKVDPLGAYVAPIVDSDATAAASTRGTNYIGADYCFKSGISSKRLQPYVGNNQALQEKFPGCTGWCASY